ncbi:Hypothetical_protein [Hexamita inflata]|uniref:Hypothetical_protein n=1 Tax=Hexamita inflata TaxID=28002 RepID=A0AA86UXK8_9EUKA|nr:Hypothetical protein HINF_LOCUS39798 [Hexamita inflata]
MRRESYFICFIGIKNFRQVFSLLQFCFYRYLLSGLPEEQIYSCPACQSVLLQGLFPFQDFAFCRASYYIFERTSRFYIQSRRRMFACLPSVQVAFFVQRTVFAHYNWYDFGLITLVVFDLCFIVLFFVPRDPNVQVDSFAASRQFIAMSGFIPSYRRL